MEISVFDVISFLILSSATFRFEHNGINIELIDEYRSRRLRYERPPIEENLTRLIFSLPCYENICVILHVHIVLFEF